MAGVKGAGDPPIRGVGCAVWVSGVAMISFEAVLKEVFSLALAGVPGLNSDGLPSFGFRGAWGRPRSVCRRVESVLCGDAAGSVAVAQCTPLPSVLGTGCIHVVMMALV